MLSSGASDVADNHHTGYNRRWYALKTKPRAETQVKDLLTRWQLQIYLPLLKRRRMEPLFPGYLFLRIDCGSHEYVWCRSAPGVSYVLNAEGVPIPVDDDLVEAIRVRLEQENRLGPADRLTRGDRVVITSGPLRGVEAIFDRKLRPQGRCLVLMGLLGSQTRVQIDATNLAKREP